MSRAPVDSAQARTARAEVLAKVKRNGASVHMLRAYDDGDKPYLAAATHGIASPLGAIVRRVEDEHGRVALRFYNACYGMRVALEDGRAIDFFSAFETPPAPPAACTPEELAAAFRAKFPRECVDLMQNYGGYSSAERRTYPLLAESRTRDLVLAGGALSYWRVVRMNEPNEPATGAGESLCISGVLYLEVTPYECVEHVYGKAGKKAKYKLRPMPAGETQRAFELHMIKALRTLADCKPSARAEEPPRADTDVLAGAPGPDGEQIIVERPSSVEAFTFTVPVEVVANVDEEADEEEEEEAANDADAEAEDEDAGVVVLESADASESAGGEDGASRALADVPPPPLVT